MRRGRDDGTYRIYFDYAAAEDHEEVTGKSIQITNRAKAIKVSGR